MRKWEQHLLQQQVEITDPNDLPVWAIDSFLLSTKDVDSQGGLSVYSATEKSELHLITAALSLKSNIDTASYAGVEKQKIENAGFKVEQTQSETRIPDVDCQHYEIEISTSGDVMKLAMMFLSGHFEKVQKAILKSSRDNAARTEKIEFCQLANDKNTISDGRLAGFIGDVHIAVTGADKP